MYKQIEKGIQITSQEKKSSTSNNNFIDNRIEAILQAKTIDHIQHYTLQMSRSPIRISGQSNIFPMPYCPTPWNACMYNNIRIPAKFRPTQGSRTSNSAPWKNFIFDAGRKNYAATRLHVLNSNLGGKGENDANNLHPGSKDLNSNHYYQAEKPFIDMLNNESYDNFNLYYHCNFQFGTQSKAEGGTKIADPDITCSWGVEGGEYHSVPITKGEGMFVPSAPTTADAGSDNDSNQLD